MGLAIGIILMLEFPIPPCHVGSPAAILGILSYIENLS
jgi:hypothetical protein